MASESANPEASVRGAGRLGWLTLLGAPALAAGGVYALAGVGVPCPFLQLTGWFCPFCGASRMGAALLAGDLEGAWRSNPFVLVLMLLLGAMWSWTAVRVASGRPAGLPGPLARLDRLRLEAVLAFSAVPALAFMVVRNLA